MAGSGYVEFDWGDTEDQGFRLGLKEIRILQEKTGLGPLALFRRIERDDWLIDDLRETIRLGLVGAGMSEKDALTKIRRHVDDFAKVDGKEPAMRILVAFLVGEPGEPVGKRSAAGDEKGATTTQEDASPSPQSTASAPR
jgi:hypothetical protein